MRALLAILTMADLLSTAFHGAINSEEDHRNPSRFFFGCEVQNLPIHTIRIIKNWFGDSLSAEDLLNIGASPDASCAALYMLADGGHNFDSPAFKNKFEHVVDYCRALARPAFKPSLEVCRAIEAYQNAHYSNVTTAA